MRAVHGTEDLPVLNEGRAWNRRPGSFVRKKGQLGIRVCEWEEWLATDDDKMVLGVE